MHGVSNASHGWFGGSMLVDDPKNRQQRDISFALKYIQWQLCPIIDALTAPVGAGVRWKKKWWFDWYRQKTRQTTNKHVFIRAVGSRINDRLYPVKRSISLSYKAVADDRQDKIALYPPKSCLLLMGQAQIQEWAALFRVEALVSQVVWLLLHSPEVYSAARFIDLWIRKVHHSHAA